MLYKNYFQYVKLKGMGFKVTRVTLDLLFRLSYSHRILYLCNNNFRFDYINKQLFKVESRSLWKLKNVISSFNTLRKLNAYKKKGLYVKGSIIKLKISSKKAKA